MKPPAATAPRAARRIVFAALVALAALLLIAVTATAVWIYAELRASLPLLEGSLPLAGLSAPVTVERDELGVPTLRGRDRRDLARATGFLHAQERFFQMDLQRRRAAGELAELFGRVALPMDREVRVHRFRARARERVASATAAERVLMDAYTDGVNAGLDALRAPPFEYRLLGSEPGPWRSEDSILTVLAMYLVLQHERGTQESALGVMHDVLPEPLFELLASRGTDWDAPVHGGPIPVPPIPGPEVFDLRRQMPALAAASPRPGLTGGAVAGSNNWAVAGSHTSEGAALVANDMHLGLSVPNIWYRVSLVHPAPDGSERRVAGLTLPGTPSVTVGSNGRIAWGFTNSRGDWADLVVLESAPGDAAAYRTPEGPRRFERIAETIRVMDGEDVTLEVLETIWGPVIDRDHRRRRRAYRWVAHDPRAVNLEIIGLEEADDVEAALEVASRSGVPAQNFVVGDREGNIGWTIVGPIPRRFGHDGRLPTSWADGERGWDGWLLPREYPRILNPESGRIWTANARVVSGEMLETVGFGGYVTGARAAQIRDALLALDGATESDMLAIQLDDRALFLARWRELLLAVLSDEAVSAHPRRRELRRYVEDWGGRAAVDSVGYHMARRFRTLSAERVLRPLVAACAAADRRFAIEDIGRQQEGPLWKIVSERPPHLLDPRFASWEELLLAVVDEMLDSLLADGAKLEQHTWGARNTVRIRHPMSRFLPLVGRWLDMPAIPMSGDRDMPRAQTVDWGPSQRMAVSPGREESGILHMPTGQSGHPLSPFYRAGHRAWVTGDPTPFLPGATRYTLRFEPAG
jgi:penicillin amidase